MKKVFAILVILMLICTAASAQEYYTLPEIREQAAAKALILLRDCIVGIVK